VAPVIAHLAIAVALSVAAPALDRWSDPVAEASARFGIPQDWIRRVMRAESGGRTELNGRPIESPKGAMGLMQVMPRTWEAMRRRYGLGSDPHDPRDNILAGAAYLREMHDRFGYPGLFAAYNAGPGRYAEHLSTGRRLPVETIAYVASVAGGDSYPAPLAPVANGILVALSNPGRDLAVVGADAAPGSVLFVRLSASDPDPPPFDTGSMGAE
jgi:soluble lytic murein transglycosylase-like protein